MEATILRSDAWKLIDSGESFAIGFVMANRRTGVAGGYIEVADWKKLQAPIMDAKPGDIRRPRRELKRDPNHQKHKTFLIHNPRNPSQHPIKVHYRLFDRFNGKTVIQ
jgi:hypothetical protein